MSHSILIPQGSLVCLSPEGEIEIWEPVFISGWSGWMLHINAFGSVQYCATFGPMFWGREVLGEL